MSLSASGTDGEVAAAGVSPVTCVGSGWRSPQGKEEATGTGTSDSSEPPWREVEEGDMGPLGPSRGSHVLAASLLHAAFGPAAAAGAGWPSGKRRRGSGARWGHEGGDSTSRDPLAWAGMGATHGHTNNPNNPRGVVSGGRVVGGPGSLLPRPTTVLPARGGAPSARGRQRRNNVNQDTHAGTSTQGGHTAAVRAGASDSPGAPLTFAVRSFWRLSPSPPRCSPVP